MGQSLLDQLKSALGAGATEPSTPKSPKSADVTAQDIADCAANGEDPNECRARLTRQQHSSANH